MLTLAHQITDDLELLGFGFNGISISEIVCRKVSLEIIYCLKPAAYTNWP